MDTIAAIMTAAEAAIVIQVAVKGSSLGEGPVRPFTSYNQSTLYYIPGRWG